MAIFKPTMCTPSFETFSIERDELPIYFYCKIDSSNLQSGLKVDGYAITIYNDENEQIFPASDVKSVDNITDILSLNVINVPNDEKFENLNTGINGSYLKIPFIVSQKAGNSVSKNQIELNDNILEFGKTYKWNITLFQGVNGGTMSNDIKYYDMQVSNGQILGSWKERIQAKYSENIYTDYFIEVGNLENNTFKKIDGTKRVRITGYDYSFGYIYPQKGVDGFGDDIIGDGKGYEKAGCATHFQIFRYGSDPENVKDKVDFCTEGFYNASESGVENGGKITYQNYIASPSSSQIIVEYEATTLPGEQKPEWWNDNDGNSASSGMSVPFMTNGTDASQNITSKSRILFNNIGKTEDGYINPSWNGIFYLYEASKSQEKEDNTTTYKKKFIFQRTTDANTWGNLISKVIYVNSGLYAGENLQTNIIDGEGNPTSDITKMIGTLNETSVYFYKEKPVEIYPNTNSPYVGTILYNNIQDRTLFIRPFSSIESGMKIFFPKLSGYPNGLTIDGFDKNIYSVKIKENLTNPPPTIDTEYLIKSCYIIGDENNFTVAKNPEIRFVFKDVLQRKIISDSPITRRNIYVEVEYSQDNFIPWRSYQFTIHDSKGNLISKEDKRYDGKIYAYFYGLLNGNKYTINLSIETQDERVYNIEKVINVSYEEKLPEIEGNTDVSFNCDTFSTIIKFDSFVGYTLPNKDVCENESGTNTIPAIGGVTYENENDEYFMRIDSTLSNIVRIIPNGDGYEISIRDGYQVENHEYDWVDYDSNEYGSVYSVSVDGFGNDGVYYDKTYSRLKAVSDGKPFVVGEETEENEEGVFSVHTTQVLRSELYEGEILGIELNSEDEDVKKKYKIDLIVPDLLGVTKITYDEERTHTFKIDNKNLNEKNSIFLSKKNLNEEADSESYRYEIGGYQTKSILPTCVPETQYGSTSYDEDNYDFLDTQVCVERGESDYIRTDNYGFIYGKYNYYKTDSLENVSNSVFPTEAPDVDDEETIGFNCSDGEAFAVGNVSTNYFELYGRSPVLWTDFKSVMNVGSYLGENLGDPFQNVNMLNLKSENKWEDYDSNGIALVWRDGDAIEYENEPDAISTLKNMKFVNKSVPEREVLNGMKIDIDLDIKTKDGEVSIENKNIIITGGV